MWRCCDYQENIKELFKQINIENPTTTPEDFKRKNQTLLTDIGGECYLNNIRNPKTLTKNPRLSNKDK